MKDHWYCRRFRVDPQFQIAGLVDGPSVFPSDMKMVKDGVEPKYMPVHKGGHLVLELWAL